MANPAPTINQINAFNATQGTIIDFNIIGGTELVRSNRIYIYDLSDNSLICTHLYVSTESIHELPANTDSSIVYESGKSSADFVNGAQYYAQIQTYTDTAGTEGGSGISVAKMFWCLVDPTLTITTIPSTISTTSYNVSATYTDTSASVVSNIIQQYQFSLYSATGSLLQSSGVVVGSGTQQGTSTAYDISYNFTGLSVGSSYYVVVDVTTTQGMNVSTQSGTFTVSIDTPTLGEATVVNNACDGYISVTSNLSGEYGGSASGEIATFETDSVNDVSSLKVTLEPKQDGTPWIGTEKNTTPYTFRAMPEQSNDYNRESLNSIVGATVAWNQMFRPQSSVNQGITFTKGDDDVITTSGTSTTTYADPFGAVNVYPNQKMLITREVIANPNSVEFSVGLNGAKGLAKGSATASTIVNQESTGSKSVILGGFLSGTDFTGIKFRAQFFDLTKMFGTSIADYAYQLEQSTAGSGVAWLKTYFPKMFAQYNEYNAGELVSVGGLSSHDTVGFNQWDEEWEVGAYSSANGTKVTASGRIRCKNPIPVVPNTTYYFKSTSALSVYGYNADGVFTVQLSTVMNQTMTIPSGICYITFNAGPNSGSTYNNDICINISKTTGTPQNGDYVAYDGHSYALDSSLTLRGIPKLDASNNLYYDGDTYASNGTVTRKYGIVDLGTLNYTKSQTGLFQTTDLMGSIKNTTNPEVATGWIISNMYTEIGSTPITGPQGSNPSPDKVCAVSSVGSMYFNNLAYTDAAAFKQAMADQNVKLVYELATPTTETATAYTSPQIVDPDGTEEYVTANSVPVGHDSTYSLECPISGYDSVSANVVGKNLLKNFQRENTTVNGLTFTNNGDGTVTVNGTATAATIVSITQNTSPYQDSYCRLSDMGILPNVQYKIHGCPSNGSRETFMLQLLVWGSGAEPYDTGSGSNAFSFTEDVIENKWYRIAIRIANGVTMNNVTFKPMICFASETDTAYEPYQEQKTYTMKLVENVWDEEWEVGGIYNSSGLPNDSATIYFRSKNYISVLPNTSYYFKTSGDDLWRYYYDAEKNYLSYQSAVRDAVATIPTDARYMKFVNVSRNSYDANTKPIAIYYPPMADGIIYGAVVDFVTGEMTVNEVGVDMGTLGWVYVDTYDYPFFRSGITGDNIRAEYNVASFMCSCYETLVGMSGGAFRTNDYDGKIAPIYGQGVNMRIGLQDHSVTNVNDLKAKISGQKLVYELATPQTYQLDPQVIQTLVGTNNVWSEDGNVEITYNIPITNLLVKRQDVADVSGTWLTLYSQPVTQASDMDFTFIDFLNQYGKTYKYALVPLLTQAQSGVEVEVEGGYTVSDEVQSIFDGVFIADSTGSQKCKANVGYGDVDMNQVVGTITPIGAKYPVVITNSKNQYHNGSIFGTIVPDDYYSNGNLSRIDMVNKRNELEQFLTNKRAKIIKDWNSNIWLVMIMDNINCTFNNEYGMGIVNFNANWIEVGDPTNQQDLQATGLIDVGGV